MSRITLLVFLMATCGCGNALDFSFLCDHDETTLKCVKYVRNYDGDTITFNIPKIHPIIGKKMPIRLKSVDTPEMNGKSECERLVARKAQKVVQEYLSGQPHIQLKNIKRGHYFRIVADVYVDNRSLSEYLLRLGLAYEYDGGKKRTDIDWCERL